MDASIPAATTLASLLFHIDNHSETDEFHSSAVIP
jgi:hypothetical protein